MPEPDQPKHPVATGIGLFAGLISQDLGAAVAVIGGLCTAFFTIMQVKGNPAQSWQHCLISGGIFVAIAIVCRWRPRR